ncbi:Hypothetical protein CINCED_3A003023 [Cinara cedri]|uniref:Uncharacterized protein n=1 Tax=Cinara cedri TaxID=506608 RepID=A0A5E4MFR3_9HEMI|nr:Hypothetical protein CINCED_3A003023 [Cinara cedri]
MNFIRQGKINKRKKSPCGFQREPLIPKSDNIVNFQNRAIAKLNKKIKTKNDDFDFFKKKHETLVDEHKILETKFGELEIQIIELEKNVQRLKFDLLDEKLQVTKEKAINTSQTRQIHKLQNTEAGLREVIRDMYTELETTKKGTLLRRLDDNSAKRKSETLKRANEKLKTKFNAEAEHIKHINSTQILTERKLDRALLNYQNLQNSYILCKLEKATEEKKNQELIKALKQKDIEADIIKKEHLKILEDVKMQLKKVIIDNTHLKSREVIYEQNRKKLAIMESCRIKCQSDMTKVENEFNSLRNRMPAFKVLNYPEHLAFIFENIDDKYLKPLKKVNRLSKKNKKTVKNPI